MAEKKKSRVNVHSKLTVVSSRPTGPGRTHQLSPLDHAMGRHSIHIVFYYRTNPFLYSDMASHRASLTELLSSYPPVTGRLARQHAEEGDKCVVKCNDAGLRMLRAKVGVTLDEWLRFGSGSDERDLTVWEEMPEDPSIWSPFRIQINDFEGGGQAIGLSCSHMHADQTSATLLVKSWTEVHRGEPISQPPVFHLPTPNSKPSPKTSQMLSKLHTNNSKACVPKQIMETATFRFLDSKMKQCLSEIHTKCPDATPFDVLLALFWMRVVRLNPPAVEQNHTHNLTICRDSRMLIRPHLPMAYFGNALHFSQLSLDTEALQSWRLEQVAGVVYNHVASVEEEELCSVVDCFETEKGKELEGYEQPFTMYGPELTCVSLEHMIIPSGPKGSTTCELMYEAMFRKDEKPVHVSYHVGCVEGEGLITVMPSPEGGLGRTVMVTLPEDQIAKLCKDEAVLDLEPILLMNGRR